MRKLALFILMILSIVLILAYISLIPQVRDCSPSSTIHDDQQTITIAFTHNIIPETVIENIVIEPEIDFSWKYDQRLLTIIPQKGWDYNQIYHLSIAKGYRHEWGIPAQDSFQATIEVGKAEEMQLSLFGDILLTELPNHFDNQAPSYAYDQLPSQLMAEDRLIIANIEAPFSTRGTEIAHKTYRFRADPAMVKVLQAGNIDAVCLANNHALDYGAVALDDTVSYCSDAGIEIIGYKPAQSERAPATIIEHDGYTIGLLAYLDEAIIPPIHRALWRGSDSASGVQMIDDSIQADIHELSAQVDFVVVSLHWGVERSYNTTVQQQTLAHQLIDSGASIVVGHHPHVAQGIERYQEGVIFYSLGNFVFPPTNEARRTTFAPVVTINESGIQGIELYPLQPTDGKPVLIPAEDALEFWKQLQIRSVTFQTEIQVNGATALVP